MKKKVIIIVSILILLISGLIIYFSFFKLDYKKEITLYIKDNVPNSKLYTNKELEIEWKDLKQEDSKLYYSGTYNGYIKYNGRKFKIKLIVKDKNKPIIEGVEDINVVKSSNIDLLKLIKVTDDSKDKLSIKIIGDYDLNKVGSYNLKYEVKDSSNTTSKDFKLTVYDSLNHSNSDKINYTKKGYKIINKNGLYYINDILIINKTYTLPSSYYPGTLATDFNTNYNKLINQSKKDNINLFIVSGFRSYNTQSVLYNNYMKRDGKKAADTYSARPGHSEHQSGLAADINSTDASMINTKEGKWLNDNCYKYGFIIRYPKGKEDITGYIYEPWHIRYVGTELATTLYNNGDWITLEEYLGITSNY